MKKSVICLLLCLVMLFSLMPVTAFADTEISTIRIHGLKYPEPNQSFNQYTAFTTNDKGISFHAVDWFDRTADRFMEGSDVFLPGHAYQVQIWVEAKDGYSFKCVNDNTPSVTATIDGYNMEVTKAFEYKAFSMVVLNYYFSYLPKKGWIKSVDLTVPAPVTGERPSYQQISTSQYATKNVYFNDSTDPNMVNGISWYRTSTGAQMIPNSDVFAANTIYNFHCLVFPQEGYGIAPNATVRVNGNIASAYLDYDTFLSVSYDFPETGDEAHTHTPSQWRTTQVYHYLVCTACGEMLKEEDHTGGTATCAEAGKCTVCGYAYLEPSEDKHIPDTSKWMIRGEAYHFHKCKICGAHCDIEDHRWSPKYHAVDASGHAYQCADCKGYDKIHPHNPGPEATDTAPQTCNDCGFIITPAKNHTHKLTKVEEVPATCMDEGMRQHYKCDGCSDLFADEAGKTKLTASTGLILGALGHTASEDYQFNEATHWNYCTRCHEALVETTFVHELNDTTCSTCGYVVGQQIPSDPANPAPPTDQSTKSEGNSVGQRIILIVGIILLSVIFTFAAIAVVVLIIVIIKKRRRN